MTEFRSLSERRMRDRALHAFVRTRVGRLQLAVGSPVCLLRVVGAGTGILRVVPVLCTPRGTQMIVVASKGGAPEHPAWYHNVRKNPDLEVDVCGERRLMRARELHGVERDDAWSYINDHFGGFELYQSAVDRVIPVLVLEPRD